MPPGAMGNVVETGITMKRRRWSLNEERQSLEELERSVRVHHVTHCLADYRTVNKRAGF